MACFSEAAEESHFLKHWFSGVVVGLESIDEAAREAILRECGKACAESYTVEVFRDAWEQSADLQSFLNVLATKFSGASYELLDSGAVRVCYAYCACDLVKWGLMETPLLCRCSVHNLEENFGRALGTRASVELEASILEGAPQCVFIVSLETDRFTGERTTGQPG
jgi:hypothetical protein